MIAKQIGLANISGEHLYAVVARHLAYLSDGRALPRGLGQEAGAERMRREVGRVQASFDRAGLNDPGNGTI